jgi:hypothetical protein
MKRNLKASAAAAEYAAVQKTGIPASTSGRIKKVNITARYTKNASEFTEPLTEPLLDVFL